MLVKFLSFWRFLKLIMFYLCMLHVFYFPTDSHISKKTCTHTHSHAYTHARTCSGTIAKIPLATQAPSTAHSKFRASTVLGLYSLCKIYIESQSRPEQSEMKSAHAHCILFSYHWRPKLSNWRNLRALCASRSVQGMLLLICNVLIFWLTAKWYVK